MRPAIHRLFDHTVRVWRPTVVRSDIGEERRDYQPVGAPLGAAINRSTAPLADIGGGLAPTGRRRLYFTPDVDVRPRDVLEIVSGPDAGGRWEVDEPPTRPRGHHTQVEALAWNGTLPSLVES